MSKEYDLYLQQHRTNVKKGYDWIKDNLPDIIPDGMKLYLEHQIGFAHDFSKNESDEYEPYDAYFYGGNRSYQVVQNYEYAWLLHIHRNPHHWQYWILVHDDPDERETIMDMPMNYILEMICDWWAFSWQKENLYEIFEWWDKHKEYIKLSDKTRKIVIDILEQIRNKLDEISELKHHGVKGMEWGVKNGPPYPIDRDKNNDNIVEKAIQSGEVSKVVNKDKQKRQTKTDHIPGRSYLNGDLDYAQELIDEYGGKGETKLDRNGKWNHRERITADNDIGIYVDEKGTEVASNTGMIVYSKTGTHIYPARRREKK